MSSFDEADIEIDVIDRSAPPRNSMNKSKRRSLPRDPTQGQRRVSSRVRTRKVDPNRRSLARLVSMPLTEAEKSPDLPPVPYQLRKCTDFLFLMLFVFYWIVMLIVGGIAFQTGNPASLIYGRDSVGRICGDENVGFQLTGKSLEIGESSDMRKRQFVAFPRVERDVDITVAGVGIDFDPLDLDLFTVCAAKCPQEGDLICTSQAEKLIADHFASDAFETRSREEVINACILNDDVRLRNENDPACFDNAIATQCFETIFNTTSFLFRCFPEFIYEVDIVGSETGCLKARNYLSITGKVVSECVKYKQVSKVTRVEPPDTSLAFEAFNTASRTFDQLLGDIVNARNVIIGTGVGVAGSTGFFYIVALRFFVGIVIWSTIILALAVLFALTLFCYFKAGIFTQQDLNDLTSSVSDFASGALSFISFDSSGDNQEYEFSDFNATDVNVEQTIDLPDFMSTSDDFAREFKFSAYFLTAVTGLTVLIIFFSFSRINRAIEFFKEASRCIQAKPQLLLIPFFSASMGVLVIAFYIAAALYVTSAGDLLNSTITLNFTNVNDLLAEQDFSSDDNITILNVFFFFGFLWSMSFVSAVAMMTISGVVAKWYWSGSPSKRKQNIREEGIVISVRESFYTVMRYHLGTAAIGSLLISFVQLVRYIAAFIQARMNKASSNNKVLRILFLCLNCCLKFAENCVKFISHNAYYMTMLYGTSFWTSTRMAFAAFAYNLIQVATVTFLGDLILRFGQLFVVATAALVSYIILDGSAEYQLGGEKELSSLLFPVFITVCLAYFMAKQVLSVYQVSIDTILISYCQDKKLLKQRDERRRSLKADVEMRDFVEKNKPQEEAFMTQPSLEVYA